MPWWSCSRLGAPRLSIPHVPLTTSAQELPHSASGNEIPVHLLSTFPFPNKNLAPFGSISQGRPLCCNNNQKISGNRSLFIPTPCPLQEAEALSQAILTWEPSYSKWPWQGAQGAQEVVKLTLALNASAQNWHLISQRCHMAICVHMDKVVQSYSTPRKNQEFCEYSCMGDSQNLPSHLLLREYLGNISTMVQTDWLDDVKQKPRSATIRQIVTASLPPP